LAVIATGFIFVSSYGTAKKISKGKVILTIIGTLSSFYLLFSDSDRKIEVGIILFLMGAAFYKNIWAPFFNFSKKDHKNDKIYYYLIIVIIVLTLLYNLVIYPYLKGAPPFN